MKTAKRAVIGTVATLATLAGIFFAGVGVYALAQGTTYMEVLRAVGAWIAAL